MQQSIFFLFTGTVFATIAVLQGSWPSFWTQSSTVSDAPPTDGTVQWVSQNFASSTNKFLNKNIIPDHLSASYRYLMMANYFSRADVSLPGFSKYFQKASERELENANHFMKYVNMRGGTVDFENIPRPDVSIWTDGIDALAYALGIERELNQHLLTLRNIAATAGDSHTTHVLEHIYLDQKVKIIKELGDHLTVLEKMRGNNYGLGEYIFDEHL